MLQSKKNPNSFGGVIRSSKKMENSKKHFLEGTHSVTKIISNERKIQLEKFAESIYYSFKEYNRGEL
jgi:hypothetical protein